MFKKDFIPDPNTFYSTWNILEFFLESIAHVDYPINGERVETDRALRRDVILDNNIVNARVVSHEET